MKHDYAIRFILIAICVLATPPPGLAQAQKPEPGLPRSASLAVKDAAARVSRLDAMAATASGADLAAVKLGQGVFAYLAGDCGRAVDLLDEARDTASSVAFVALYYRGLAYYKLGMYSEALDALQAAAEDAAKAASPVAQASNYVASLCLEKTGQAEAALDLLRPLLERPEPAVLPYALFRAASLAASLGRFAETGTWLSRLYRDHPGGPLDAQAAVLAAQLSASGKIDWQPDSVDTLSARAYALLRRAQNSPALAEIERAEKAATGDQAVWLAYLKGKAWFALRKTQAAREQFEELCRAYPASNLVPYAMLQQARCFWRTGSSDDADRMESVLTDALRQFPSSEAGPLLRRFLMLSRLERGRFDDALAAARELIASGPGGRFSAEALKIAGDQIKNETQTEFVEQARYLEGLILYALTRYAEAADALAGFSRDWPDSQELPGALYWLGQTRLKLNDPARAAEAFGTNASLRPNTYYGAKSASALTAAGLGSAPAPDAGFPCPGEPAPNAATANPAADAALARASILEAALVPELAEMELNSALASDPANPRLAFAAARVDTVNGRHQAATAAIYRAFPACLARGTKDKLSPIEDMLYPLKYAELVRAGLAGTSIEPEFVFSLIRQESFFDPGAVSRAGAVGLMQVLPETARDLAATLRDAPPSRERLLDPAVNIRYGTAYLARKYERLGNPVYLLCDYNAGPAKLAFWRENLGGLPPDLFVEFIPYTETRDYVRRILANMAMYRLLYR